mmetsp:Transcript_20228/g.64163  ORF Transcript_20228/g.64163 Transcript_20228/m.64163 type:complete len:234 (+) Transcript_20228:3-704(+)
MTLPMPRGPSYHRACALVVAALLVLQRRRLLRPPAAPAPRAASVARAGAASVSPPAVARAAALLPLRLAAPVTFLPLRLLALVAPLPGLCPHEIPRRHEVAPPRLKIAAVLRPGGCEAPLRAEAHAVEVELPSIGSVERGLGRLRSIKLHVRALAAPVLQGGDPAGGDLAELAKEHLQCYPAAVLRDARCEVQRCCRHGRRPGARGPRTRESGATRPLPRGEGASGAGTAACA